MRTLDIQQYEDADIDQYAGTGVCGLELLVYEALATSECALKLLAYAALSY